MLLHYEHEAEADVSPEVVAERLMACRFSFKNFSYQSEREPDGVRVFLRPKYNFWNGSWPMPEIMITPESEQSGTCVKIKARPGAFHWSFFCQYTAGAVFFFVLSLLILAFGHNTEALLGLMISTILGAGGYGMMSFALGTASRELFRKIERAIQGIIQL